MPETELTESKTLTDQNDFRERLVNQRLISSGWLSRVKHPNGKDLKITVRDVWELYKKDHLPTVSASTRINKDFRCSKFLPPLFDVRMCELTPQLISEFVRYNLEGLRAKPSVRRFNFKKELKDFQSISRWYTDNIDFLYANPIKQHHFKLAVVRDIPRKQREITVAQFQLFMTHLPEFYKKLVLYQYLTASRIGEAAGLQWKNVDFERRIITIQEIIIWLKGRPHVKDKPKNGTGRACFASNAMIELLQARLKVRNGSEFVFHKNGKPLLYSAINANYNRAWKKAGLTQFRSTHLVRYFSAQRARVVSGSIDGVKSVTGQGIQMAQKYSDYSCADQNRDTIEKMEIALLGDRAGG